MNCQTLTRRSCRTRQASISGRGMRGRNQRVIKSLGSSAGVRWWLGVPKRTLLGPDAKGSGGNSSGSLNPRPNPDERAASLGVPWRGQEFIKWLPAQQSLNRQSQTLALGRPLRCAVAESPRMYQERKPRGGRTLESGNAGAGSLAAGLHGNSSPCQEVFILAVQVSKS